MMSKVVFSCQILILFAAAILVWSVGNVPELTRFDSLCVLSFVAIGVLLYVLSLRFFVSRDTSFLDGISLKWKYRIQYLCFGILIVTLILNGESVKSPLCSFCLMDRWKTPMGLLMVLVGLGATIFLGYLRTLEKKLKTGRDKMQNTVE